MLKKGIYIFTAFCLLNTMFCFSAGDLSGEGRTAGLTERETHAGGSTLLDFLIQQFQDDDDGESKAPLRIKGRHHYFLTRSLSLNIQARMQSVFGMVSFFKPAPVLYGNYLIRKASLPSYYNFLFRLNPF